MNLTDKVCICWLYKLVGASSLLFRYKDIIVILIEVVCINVDNLLNKS